MNIISKKYKEIYKNPQTKIGGMWNISIVTNNDEFFPFGKDMKNNLILDQGLDILVAGKYYGPGQAVFLDQQIEAPAYALYNWNTIPSFLIGGAVYGNSSMPLLNNDTGLNNETTETRVVNDDSCAITDNLINGTRTFRKVYDFPIIEIGDTNTEVREVGIFTDWKSTKTIFAKFLLPRTIKLAYGQYLRLFYDFTIGSDMITSSSNINISSGTFNGSGEIRLCGRFDDIFGSFDINGNPVIKYGDSSRASFVPYYENFCAERDACQTECFGTAYMLSPGILNFYSPNQRIISEWIGNRLEQRLNTINPSNYINGNYYRDIEYILDNNNPIYNENIEGFLFTVLRGSPTSPRQNTVDGWLWKFNNNQVKQSSKKIVIMLRQSIMRI